ncbi:helicase HerA-like domain-containing protein [Microtetraspora malaysiensis]|uniref:helicase HerA-like domain-containing protein n=1 Tax=Microtetraspora malaysiensis TaxID=161358 RepID=UPI003D8CEA62
MKGYDFEGPALELGAQVADGRADPAEKIRIPLGMMNRHGLVAGATGTGKTKTLQMMAEQLAAQGVPVFLADVKGDLSGLASPNVRQVDVRVCLSAVVQDASGAR